MVLVSYSIYWHRINSSPSSSILLYIPPFVIREWNDMSLHHLVPYPYGEDNLKSKMVKGS